MKKSSLVLLFVLTVVLLSALAEAADNKPSNNFKYLFKLANDEFYIDTTSIQNGPDGSRIAWLLLVTTPCEQENNKCRSEIRAKEIFWGNKTACTLSEMRVYTDGTFEVPSNADIFKPHMCTPKPFPPNSAGEAIWEYLFSNISPPKTSVANWVYLYTLESGDHYIDSNSLKQEGAVVQYKMKLVCSEKKQILFKMVQYFTSEEIDCEKKMHRTVEIGPNVKTDGQVVPAKPAADTSWTEIISAMVDDYNFVCRK